MNDRGSIIPAVCWIYAALLVAGFGLMYSPLSLPVGSETSMYLQRAVFLVVNAGTLTGFQTTLSVDSLRAPAQWTILALTLGGAMLNWIVGGILVARALRLDFTQMQIVGAAGMLALLAAVAGALVAPPMELFDSILRTISAVGNSGVWIGRAPASRDPQTLALFLPLAVLGGIGVTVLLELFRWPRARSLSRHAAVALAMTAGVYVLGTLLIFAAQWLSGVAGDGNWRSQMSLASSLSINSRSAGMPMLLLNDLPRATQWVVGLLMLLGAAPGGAAGGIGLTTIYVLLAGLARLLRGAGASRVFGIAVAWFIGYLLALFVTFIALLLLVPEMSADRVLMLAVSAVGNVGLSHDVISMGRNALVAVSAAMLAGRILPLLVLWWVSRLDEVEVAVG